MTTNAPSNQKSNGVIGIELPAGTLRIAQITDTHLYADSERRLLGINTLESMRQVIDLVQDTGWPLDMVLATGDLVHDSTPAGYRLASLEFSRLGVPVYCLPGNHDVSQVMRNSLGINGMSMPGHVDTEHWRLIMLDSVIPDEEGGHLEEKELLRLQQSLQEQDRHTLVCLHHQPLPVGSAWIDTMALDNGQAFFDIIDRHPHVQGVLWGHIHQVYEGMHSHVRLMASPSTCIQFTAGEDAFQVDTLPPGCRLLALLPDGTIRSEVLRLAKCPDGLDLESSGY